MNICRGREGEERNYEITGKERERNGRWERVRRGKMAVELPSPRAPGYPITNPVGVRCSGGLGGRMGAEPGPGQDH